MKKFLSIMVMLSLAVVVCRPVCAQNKDTHVDEKLQAVQELYNYYTELEDVTGIHISSSMLELLSVFSEGTDVALDDFAVDDMTVVNHMDLKKLKSLYILVADNAKSASEMTKSANHNILKRFGDYIELLQISNIEEDVTFYYSSPDGQYVDDLLMLQAEKDPENSKKVLSVTMIYMQTDSLAMRDIIGLAGSMGMNPAE